MNMDIRPHWGEDALVLARPEPDKRHVLVTQLKWDLDFSMRFHARRSIRRRVDDMEIDQFRLSRHHEWKRLGQPSLCTGFANKSFDIRVGRQFRNVLGLPSGDFRPHEERHARLKALGHMDKVAGTDPREGWSAVRNRHVARQSLDRAGTVDGPRALERPQVEL